MKENKSLVVSEKFFSIQGEGKTVGTPAVFLRLSGCNILCQSESWVCDSIEVWKKGTKTPFNEILTGELFEKLQAGAHLVITGGEPLLHQKAIVEYIKWFSENYFMPTIEVETNGTIVPDSYLQMVVKHWNVSPKLLNSGESFDKRFKPEVIEVFRRLSTSIFKFVMEKEEDFNDFVKSYALLLKGANDRVYLMPAGATQEELLITRPIIVELCKEHCLRFTDRSHIVIWNKKTGV